MSLLGSLQIANNALFASQVGLQVTGNNIANANTPGYVRQRPVFTPATTQLIGELPLGLGVQVEGIIQQSDRFLSERLRGAISDLAGSEAQEEAYVQLEALIGELTDTDLSTSFSNFFNAINDVLNQPEDVSVRNLAVLQGGTLTDDIRRIDSRILDIRTNINSKIVSSASDINRLLSQIAELNVNIVQTEGGSTSASDAVGLRDQREVALAELSKIVKLRVVEQPTGSVSVFADGDFLVFEGVFRPVEVEYTSDRGLSVATINLAATDAPIAAFAGSLAGNYAARDSILGGFLDELDELASTLAFEFNKIYSSGQGLTGLKEAESERSVSSEILALDQTGLPFTPVNGSFEIKVFNTRTGLTKTEDIFVNLNGLKDDTTLESLTASLNDIEGLVAQITPDRKLKIESDSPILEFGFGSDTSHVLAAIGLNTFFSGSNSRDIGVSDVVRDDPSKFAASEGGVGEDTNIALRLAAFADTPLEARNGQTFVDQYEDTVAKVTQASSVTKAVSEGFRVFQRTLEGQNLGLTGVSIDEEAINMISYQRTYQASARLVATISELLNVLMTL
ncbi:MAG: flagellar hook-associated protein FlgK [Planctomycetaceae bacterium]|nr:flagellar hook-associated protein FlgK [Planctomycetales bacterium]MCB9926000.1 flagellar hook-associated protein FlgK [Planctomycetaceae bacterium]